MRRAYKFRLYPNRNQERELEIMLETHRRLLRNRRLSRAIVDAAWGGFLAASHLLASYCKPWRDSSNKGWLNGENGLLLTANIDHLIERRFIGLED